MKFLPVLIACLITLSSLAQPWCNFEPEGKLLKLYQKGIDKKNEKADRLDFLRQCVEEAPEFAEAQFALAIERIKTAKYEGKGYGLALANLEAVAQHCPDFHSDVYYYLGSIYMGKQEFAKAELYLQKFLAFQSDDEAKFSKDYIKKYEQAQLDFKFASFFAQSYANPKPFNPQLVQNISTDDDEYLPLVSPDNELIYFTRKSEVKRAVKATYIQSDKPEYEEKFMKAAIVNRNFEQIEPLPQPFNQDKDNYGGATISLDNRELILTVCKPTFVGGQNYNNCDLYVSRYEFSYDKDYGAERWHWTALENLGENINTQGGWESQPSLSGDGKTLYFATFRETTKGIDIFSANRLPNGNWDVAKPLSDVINSDYHDKSPFIHSDSQTLYYASQGKTGFGGFDIFYARQKPDGSWGEPVNLGYPINTENDEHGLIVATNGEDVYFSSDQLKADKLGLNIYTFKLYNDARPEKVAFVKGKALDENGNAVKAGTVTLKNMETNTTAEFKVDSADGSFAAIVTVNPGDKVVMQVKTPEKSFNAKLIPTAPDSTGKYAEVNVEVKPIKKGKTFNLQDIFYATNSADIAEESKFILDEFTLFLKENPDLSIEIRGHTDNIGKAESNLALSSDRAFSVMMYLQSNGIAKERLSFKGFGSTMPVANNATAQGRALNRRTEFFVR